MVFIWRSVWDSNPSEWLLTNIRRDRPATTPKAVPRSNCKTINYYPQKTTHALCSRGRGFFHIVSHTWPR